MTEDPRSTRVTNESSEITWNPESRLALVRYTEGANLREEDGTLLVNSLTEWIGAEGEPFGILADAKGLRGTDPEYRAKTGAFFKRHREVAYIALIHMGPVIRIVTDMFRIGTGVQLKGFADEAGARSWLRNLGILA